MEIRETLRKPRVSRKAYLLNAEIFIRVQKRPNSRILFPGAVDCTKNAWLETESRQLTEKGKASPKVRVNWWAEEGALKAEAVQSMTLCETFAEWRPLPNVCTRCFPCVRSVPNNKGLLIILCRLTLPYNNLHIAFFSPYFAHKHL